MRHINVPAAKSLDYRAYVVAAVAISLVAAVVLWLFSRDGTEKVFNAFEDEVVPQTQTSQTLIAPASKEWWEVAVVLSEAGTKLAVADVPTNATWVGFSSGLAQKTSADRKTLLTVLYIGFDDEAAAAEYVDGNPFDGGYLRANGNVAQVIPYTSEFGTESFPKKAPIIDGKPSSAMWHINLTEEVSYLGSQGEHAEKFVKFAEALGISSDANDPTTWTGKADDVKSAFTGTLTTNLSDEAKKSKSNRAQIVPKLEFALETAVGVADSTAEYSCEDDDKGVASGDSNCLRVDDGLYLMDTGMTMSAGEARFGDLADSGKTTYSNDKDVDFSGAFSPKTIRAALAGSMENESGPLRRIDFGYDALGQELHLMPILGDVKDYSKPLPQKDTEKKAAEKKAAEK